MIINAGRSPDKRLKTDTYEKDGGRSFSLAEPTHHGTLITEFKINGEVSNQLYVRTGNSLEALSGYLEGIGKLNIVDIDAYEHVKIEAACIKCGAENIERELDQHESENIVAIPVVPMFVCKKCDNKFYSMSDTYLRHLVARKEMLFEPEEMRERTKDEGKFIRTLQDNIIRIFASKRIQRLQLKG